MVFDIAPISQSHVTNQIWIEPDDRVMADIKILETPIGRSLRQLLEPVHDHFTFRIAGTGDLVDGMVQPIHFNDIYKSVCKWCIEASMHLSRNGSSELLVTNLKEE